MIEKQLISSFFMTSLASVLIDMKVDTVAICGYSTSGCVSTTTTDAMQYGFCPFLVGDAYRDRRAYSHDANLFNIQAKFGEVVSTEKILQLMVREGEASER